jgi:hypothetical protein
MGRPRKTPEEVQAAREAALATGALDLRNPRSVEELSDWMNKTDVDAIVELLRMSPG